MKIHLNPFQVINIFCELKTKKNERTDEKIFIKEAFWNYDSFNWFMHRFIVFFSSQINKNIELNGYWWGIKSISIRFYLILKFFVLAIKRAWILRNYRIYYFFFVCFQCIKKAYNILRILDSFCGIFEQMTLNS